MYILYHAFPKKKSPDREKSFLSKPFPDHSIGSIRAAYLRSILVPVRFLRSIPHFPSRPWLIRRVFSLCAPHLVFSRNDNGK